MSTTCKKNPLTLFHINGIHVGQPWDSCWPTLPFSFINKTHWKVNFCPNQCNAISTLSSFLEKPERNKDNDLSLRVANASNLVWAQRHILKFCLGIKYWKGGTAICEPFSWNHVCVSVEYSDDGAHRTIYVDGKLHFNLTSKYFEDSKWPGDFLDIFRNQQNLIDKECKNFTRWSELDIWWQRA